MDVALAGLLPPLAQWLCARAGLDHAVLSDRERGFDLGYYERAAGRRFACADAALFHYLSIGSRQGLRPRADFDPAGYRRCNPDVAALGYEPFAHYYRFGREEGRGGTPADDVPDDSLLSLPTLSQMLQRPRPAASAAKVDVIIPVYGNRLMTLRTIDSVLASTVTTPYELIVLDDGSRDPVLRQELKALADAGLLTLLSNERNMGFVATANRGFALHDDRDVILLNSDTHVFGDWLDRLLKALHGTPKTATASPISNAATILSYPITLRDNHRLPGMDFAALDRLCVRLEHPPVELPTALGFCLAVKRTCLREVGKFDAERFGHGYGEENDFSLRAMASGWRHVAATNVFVWHRSGASFGQGREALIEAAQQTLERMHPGYAASVQRFIRSDPLSSVREALDAARVRSDPRRKVLRIGERSRSSNEEVLVLTLVPEIAPFNGSYRIRAVGFPPIPNLRRMRRGTPVEDWVRMMRALDVQQVVVQGIGAGNLGRWRQIVSAARTAGLVIA